MEHIYKYSWIIPFVILPVPMLTGAGLPLFLAATEKTSSYGGFPSVLLSSMVMVFSTNLSIQQINSSFIGKAVGVVRF